ncbi:predicted protein [Postia placenta Mad-698-R]|nr:predicted protein [Postia placenta Mad-698-R]
MYLCGDYKQSCNGIHVTWITAYIIECDVKIQGLTGGPHGVRKIGSDPAGSERETSNNGIGPNLDLGRTCRTGLGGAVRWHATYFEWEGWADPENSLTKRWWPAMQYHIGYKWIWLNAHRAKGALRIEVERDVKFADELLEQELMEPRADDQS